jgi:glycosyltransferase involved in cell wall biosynthesis
VLTILSVAYPLAPVSLDAVGGAEQILALLDRAITKAGHRSLVVACEGSSVAGELITVPCVRGPLDGAGVAAARARHRPIIEQALQRTSVDLVHMHGVDFDNYLPTGDVPVLATLHCPPDWYSKAALRPRRPRTYLNAVSASQHAMLAQHPGLLDPIENGIEVDAFSGRYRRRPFALMLSRIAPEKGVHVALRAAHQARVPLIVAGELFPYPQHSRYFTCDVEPLLDRERRYIGPVGHRAKRRLLGSASCVVVCSQVAETSSLVAREAMAAGTPVVALRGGALADVVDHGSTGFLADNEHALAAALQHVGSLDREACRRTARERFDAAIMAQAYLRTYERLIRGEVSLGLGVAGAA